LKILKLKKKDKINKILERGNLVKQRKIEKDLENQELRQEKEQKASKKLAKDFKNHKGS
jgi:hypothetical protein